MSNHEIQAELEELRARVARLEAKEAVLGALNRYLYSIDTGFSQEIIDCFTDDAVLDVPNFPGAGGQDLHFQGRTEIAPLYERYEERGVRISGGHHTANIGIDVAFDLARAEVSSYFMTSTASGVQGGRYEGVMRREADGRWRWESLTITSSWGWRAIDYEVISEEVSIDHSPFGGHHVTYTPHPS